MKIWIQKIKKERRKGQRSLQIGKGWVKRRGKERTLQPPPHTYHSTAQYWQGMKPLLFNVAWRSIPHQRRVAFTFLFPLSLSYPTPNRERKVKKSYGFDVPICCYLLCLLLPTFSIAFLCLFFITPKYQFWDLLQNTIIDMWVSSTLT